MYHIVLFNIAIWICQPEGGLLFISEISEADCPKFLKSGLWEAGSTVENIVKILYCKVVKILYCKGNIDTVSYCKSFKGAIP